MPKKTPLKVGTRVCHATNKDLPEGVIVGISNTDKPFYVHWNVEGTPRDIRGNYTETELRKVISLAALKALAKEVEEN